jgi:predicted DNA binding CopG/RHH family protein
MKREYDLSKMKSRPNRFAKRLTRQVTIRMGITVISYFKRLAIQTGIPYQKLINLYLADCVESGRTPSLKWSR